MSVSDRSLPLSLKDCDWSENICTYVEYFELWLMYGL